jgi:phage shock protein C
MNQDVKRLYRSRTNRMVAGVCGGLGEYLRLDPTVVRLAIALLTVLTGFLPVVVFYIVMMIIVPESPAGEPLAKEAVVVKDAGAVPAQPAAAEQPAPVETPESES